MWAKVLGISEPSLETLGGAVKGSSKKGTPRVLSSHLKRLQWREKVRTIPQDLQTTAEQKSEWPLGGKMHSAALKRKQPE